LFLHLATLRILLPALSVLLAPKLPNKRPPPSPMLNRSAQPGKRRASQHQQTTTFAPQPATRVTPRWSISSSSRSWTA
jgi:hypothetical protein